MRFAMFSGAAFVLATLLCASATAQLVTATATSIAPLVVSTTFANNSAPSGTVLTPGFTIRAQHGSPGLQYGFATANFLVTTQGNSVTYTIRQDCSVTESSTIVQAYCGYPSLNSPQNTKLTLTSAQPVSGVLTITATGTTSVNSATAPTFTRLAQVDIGNAPAPNTVFTMAFAALTTAAMPLPPFGELLIAPPWIAIPGTPLHTLNLPSMSSLIGFRVSVQGLRLNAVGPNYMLDLTNAIDAVMGV